MNALSAIRQMIPGLQGSAPVSGSPAGGAIPAAELEKLVNTGLAQSPTAPAQNQFSNMLGQMVREVNNKQAVASQMVSDLQSGQGASLHQTMIAMEEASVSFQLMVEVRNKLLESYQELMRMQV